MVCPKCGNLITEDANFCRNCGAALHTGEGNATSAQGEKKRKQGLFHQPAILLAGAAVLLLAVSGGVLGYRILHHEGGMSFLMENEKEEPENSDRDDEEQKEADAGSGKQEEESRDSEDIDDTQPEMAASEAETAPVNTWQQIDNQWRYYDERGEMMTNAWVGNYYVGMDGVMQVNTLTPDGYWLDETGLASEDKRIYGECVFHPTSYRKDGNGFLITGDICDTGYASEEYLRSLQVGDVILRPADEAPVGACVFDTESVITEVTDYPGYSYGANGEYQEDGTVRRAVCTQSTAPPDDPYGDQYYTFCSDSMTWWQFSSMDCSLYRIIENDVVLIFSENADFVLVNPEWDYVSQSMSEFLETKHRGVLKVKVVNGRILQAVDILNNYAG